MRDRGIQLIPPRQGLQILEQLLADDVGQVAVLPGNWAALTDRSSSETPWLLLELVRADAASTNGAHVGGRLRAAGGLNGADRRAALVTFLRHNVALVLRSRRTRFRCAIHSTCWDSIRSWRTELRNRVETQLQIDVPVVKFMEGQSVLELAAEIDRRMPVDGLFDSATRQQRHPDRYWRPTDVKEIDSLEAHQLLARLDDLSDEEVEALLTGNPEHAFAEGAD